MAAPIFPAFSGDHPVVFGRITPSDPSCARLTRRSNTTGVADLSAFGCKGLPAALGAALSEAHDHSLIGPMETTLGAPADPGSVITWACAIGPKAPLLVHATGPQGSAILRSMSEANCFIVLPHGWGRVEPGILGDVQPFFGLV